MKYICWISIGLSLVIVPATIGLENQTAAQTAPLHSSLRQTLTDFFNRDGDDVEDRSRGRAGTSRGSRDRLANERLCILTPGRNETIWHQQPLFVMQGLMNRIAVRREADLTQPSNPDLWSHSPVPDADRLAIAKTDPLQPGYTYEWLFYETASDTRPTYVLPFSVMAMGAERDRIATDLAQLEAELTQQGASTEAIAQAKANYFLAKDMPADALHILFDMPDPSADLVALRAETVEMICRFPLGRGTPLAE